jgi:hypothetical protein
MADKFRLYDPRRERLVENKVSKDKWNLTEMGHRRLEYYERKEQDREGIPWSLLRE